VRKRVVGKRRRGGWDKNDGGTKMGREKGKQGRGQWLRRSEKGGSLKGAR